MSASISPPPPSFAYVFARFPSFTQTFCAREVEEMQRQGVPLKIYSLERVDHEPNQTFPPELREQVTYLPDEKELERIVNDWCRGKRLPKELIRVLKHWGGIGDRLRALEAVWLGEQLRAQGIWHIHTHFGGKSARTAFWLKEFYGIGYSFTAHANDFFWSKPQTVCRQELAEAAEFVVNVSDYGGEELTRSLPTNCGPVRKVRVYNGIDLRDWNLPPPEPPAADAPLEIVSVGRLIVKKGFGTLITACRLMKDRGMRPFLCHIIGEGPLHEELKQQIAKEGLEQIVFLHGNQSQAAIQRYLNQASLFALACTVEEDGGRDNLPTVIMEAMAASLPVVSTFLAAVPEMVLEEKTGLLVQPDDADALAGAIGRILADPSLVEKWGLAGLQLCEELFDVRKTVRQLKHALHKFGALNPSEEAAKIDPELREYFAACRERVVKLQANAAGPRKGLVRSLVRRKFRRLLFKLGKPFGAKAKS